MRRLFEKMAADIEYHTDVMMHAIRKEVPAYGAITDPRLVAEVRSMTRTNLAIWHRILLDQHPPTDEVLAPVAAFARRRYHQGISLADLLHSFRSGANAAWQEILHTVRDDQRIQAEMLMNISPYLLQHTDHLGQALSYSYLNEAHRSRRWRDRRQQELSALILNSPGDHKRFRELTEDLQIDSNGRRSALVIQPEELPGEDVFGQRLDQLLHKAAEYLQIEQEPLHAHRDGRLMLWLPLVAGADPILGERALAMECNRLVQALPEFVHAIGVGLFRRDALGWRASAEQALKALEGCNRIAESDDSRVHSYADVILQDSAVTHRCDAGYFEGLLRLLEVGS